MLEEALSDYGIGLAKEVSIGGVLFWIKNRGDVGVVDGDSVSESGLGDGKLSLMYLGLGKIKTFYFRSGGESGGSDGESSISSDPKVGD